MESRPKKPRLSEWSHFIILDTSGNGSTKTVKCKLCPWKTAANASRMKKHYEGKHAAVEPVVMEPSGAQKTMTKYLERGYSSAEQEKAQRLLILLKIRFVLQLP